MRVDLKPTVHLHIAHEPSSRATTVAGGFALLGDPSNVVYYRNSAAIDVAPTLTRRPKRGRTRQVMGCTKGLHHMVSRCWLPLLTGTACVVAISTSARPTDNFYRRTSFDTVEFGGRLSIDCTLPGVEASRFAQFLTPSRVVAAAWDPRMIQALSAQNGARDSEELFRLKQEPIDFAGAMQVETTVDVAVQRVGSGLKLSSRDINCMARVGLDRPRKLDINIQLEGELRPQSGKIARMLGSFEFTTGGRLIPPLLLLPDPVLYAAATAVNAGILQYARERFVTGISKDFKAWDRQQAASSLGSNQPPRN